MMALPPRQVGSPGQSAPVRVVVIDDSAFVRRAVHRMLDPHPDIEIAGSGDNGVEALELVRTLRPDVVLMDLNMPEMDGLEALRHIMAEVPTPVVLMSTQTQAGAEVTLQALELGAVDFIDKSSVGAAMNIFDLAPLIHEKLVAVGRAGIGQEAVAPAPAPTPAGPVSSAARAAGEREIVAIAASTGGPRALAAIIPALPEDFGATIVVAQHMPAGFTTTLAARLDRRSAVHVSEAVNGEELRPGRVLIAPGRQHLTVVKGSGGLRVRVSDEPAGELYRPSADLLFASVAETVGERAVGLVLTGMGSDGSAGLQQLQAAGARTIVESEETAVIYGMPAAARKYAGEVLPLPRIAAHLAGLCRPVQAQRREDF